MGYLVAEIGISRGFLRITQAGREALIRASVGDLAFRKILAKELVHPLLFEKAYSHYLEGQYEDAVMQASKRLELAVKAKCRPQFQDFTGTDLMNAAFKTGANVSESGPLTNFHLGSNEQNSIRFLYNGAMGAIRNPNFHRDDELDGRRTAQILMFISYLLGMLDGKR